MPRGPVETLNNRGLETCTCKNPTLCHLHGYICWCVVGKTGTLKIGSIPCFISVFGAIFRFYTGSAYFTQSWMFLFFLYWGFDSRHSCEPSYNHPSYADPSKKGLHPGMLEDEWGWRLLQGKRSKVGRQHQDEDDHPGPHTILWGIRQIKHMRVHQMNYIYIYMYT